MSSHDWSWQGHVRFFGVPLGLCSQFCCSGFSAIFFLFFFCASWYRDSARPRHGSLCQRGSPEARLDKPSLTEWWARPISYHKQQQHHYHPITDQEIKSRRVLKGIIWAILGFFTMGRCGGEQPRRVQCVCPLWLTAALHSVVGKRREEEQGPKQICFPQRGCLATTAAPHLCLEPSLPLQRDPLCNPNWELILHSSCLTLKAPQHRTRLMSNVPTHVLYLVCKH